jgi:TolB protein
MTILDRLLLDASSLAYLVNLAVAATLLSGCGLFAARVCRSCGAPLRHGILLGSLILVLVLPGTLWLGQQSGWTLVQLELPSQPVAVARERGKSAAVAQPLEISEFDRAGAVDRERVPTALPIEQSLAIQPATDGRSASEAQVFHSFAIPWWQIVGTLLAYAWILGIGVGGMRFAREYAAILRFRGSLEEIADQRIERIAQWAAEVVGLRNVPARFTSLAAPAPLCLGILRPAIVLPDEVVTDMGDEQLRDIFIHEAAHLARRDPWVALAARIGVLLHWWNPLLYRVRDGIAKEREDICDNYVCQAAGNGVRFARTLVELAARTRALPFLPATVGILERSGLAGRVTSLLNKERMMATRMNGKTKSVVIAGTLATLLLSAVAGGLKVAHSQQAPPAAKKAEEGGERQADASEKSIPLRGLPVPPSNDIYSRVFIGEADGSRMRPLVDLGDYKVQGAPTWSSDGKFIALETWRPELGEANLNSQIVVVNSDGSEPRFLGDGGMPSFSPGGDRIAFTRYDPFRGVWLMSSEGPAKELVLIAADGWSARWSPDGKQIAYILFGDNPNLVVFDLVKGEPTLLFEKEKCPYRSFLWNFAWSPDGGRIAFKGQRASDGRFELGIVDVRGAQHGLVTRHLGETFNITWGPDSKQILFSQASRARGGRMQLFTLDADTQDPPVLLPGQDPMRRNTLGTLSPDGMKLLMLSLKPAPAINAKR